MSVPARIGVLVVVVCAGYTWVGMSVPQKEQHPPADVGASASPADLAKAGEGLYVGQCQQCHGAVGSGGTDRAPDLDGVAERANERAALRTQQTGTPYTPDDYLAESLLDTGAYLVERAPGQPYGNIMSFKLDANQTLAVLTWLQTLGADATLDANSEVWQKWGAALIAEAASGGGGGGPKDVGPPEKIIETYKCVGCHDFEGTKIPPGGGPPLSDIGARMSPGDILMQIIDPDSVIAKPIGETVFQAGVMKAGLAAFYQDVGGEDLAKLALWLAAKKGPAKGGQ